MTWTSKPFFIYCLIASLFLTISGVNMYVQSHNPAPFLVSLPVSGYFIYYISRSLFYKKPLPEASSSPHADVSILLILIALLIGSLYTVIHHQGPDNSPQRSQFSKRP